MAVLSRRVVEQCRVVVDNDFAGDPDGILALAHHLLSPSNRVVAITSAFLNPRFVVPPATPGATAEDGARLADRDTDPAAAEAVFLVAGLEIHQFPVETYRRCAYGIAELEVDLPATGRLGAWLFDRFSSPPDQVRLGGVWPLGDSPPLLITALTTDSSTWSTPSDGVTVYTVVDMRLLVGDLLGKLRLHERARSDR